MTLQQMEYVMAVHRFGHFAKAADYCNVTQPTLSSMIQKLEDELAHLYAVWEDLAAQLEEAKGE